MKINSLSSKQLLTLKWWAIPKFSGFDAIICDGAVRSGKTFSMSLGFVSWAMSSFNHSTFALCGKTVTSLKRNVIDPLICILNDFGFVCSEKVSKNFFDIRLGNFSNRFYLFGGKDESSASLIQGITLSGVFLDEVALMPRSFVEQALARCSVSGSKLWFNCNPDHPYHWFYREWILNARQKNALYLHFTMDDNPSLSQSVKQRYKTLYSGAFFERFVLGKWSAVSGVVYPMFSNERHVFSKLPACSDFVVSCDYGTVNPSSFGLWGLAPDGKWLRLKEYYYDSRLQGSPRTDEEHYNALLSLTDGFNVRKVIVDPSAASFIECIRRHKIFNVVKANNDVISGIRRVADALSQDKIAFHCSCCDLLREFHLYSWNEKSGGDIPIKENDHAMDDLRYFVSEMLCDNEDCFFVGSVAR